jgi:hypothetical protein
MGLYGWIMSTAEQIITVYSVVFTMVGGFTTVGMVMMLVLSVTLQSTSLMAQVSVRVGLKYFSTTLGAQYVKIVGIGQYMMLL